MYKWLYNNVLIKMDAESIHDKCTWLMERFPYSRFTGKLMKGSVPEDRRLEVEVAGIKFKNPIGVAAGMDKKASIFPNLLELGFGFVEVGTVTLERRLGNPKPRIWRTEDGIINHMGLPNPGVKTIRENIWCLKRKGDIVGVSIAPEHSFLTHEDSLSRLFVELYGTASYITINLSCPNVNSIFSTEDILNRLSDNRKFLEDFYSRSLPIFVKSGFGGANNLKKYVDLLLKYDISGIVLINTIPISEKGMRGGLSGPELMDSGLKAVSVVFNHTNGTFPIIGCGGIESSNDVLNYIEAGASLVQLYTGFVKNGPRLPASILNNVLNKLEDENIMNLRGQWA